MPELSFAVIAPLVVLQLILMTTALISCIKSDETNGPKWLWVLIIVIISILGPVAFFVAGRKNQG